MDRGDAVEKSTDIPPVHEDFTESLDFELDLAADAQKPRPSDTEAAPDMSSAPPRDDLSASLDIDLALDAAASATPAAMEPVTTLTTEEPSASLELDIDLDLDSGAPQPVVKDMAAADDSMMQQGVARETSDEMNFDFDLGGGKPVESPALPQVDEGNMIDFDLNLPAPATTQPATESEDLASIDLEIGEPVAAGTAQSFDLSSLSLALDGSSAPPATPEPSYAADQEVATKYESALAYAEIGANEGARELLQEVINERHAGQQETSPYQLAPL